MERISIGQLARRSGVSARMLRHYDSIGLFPPAEVSENGYRWYAIDSLPRLSRIVALRRAGLGLAEIQRVLNDGVPDRETLARHRERLRSERLALDRLIAEIESQIVDLGAAARQVSEVVAGNAQRERDDFSARLAAQFGEAAALARDGGEGASLTTADREYVAAASAGVFVALAELMRAGAEPDSREVQAATAEHFAEVCRVRVLGLREYGELGKLYVTDPLQRRIAEHIDPAFPEWLSRAVQAFAGCPRGG